MKTIVNWKYVTLVAVMLTVVALLPPLVRARANPSTQPMYLGTITTPASIFVDTNNDVVDAPDEVCENVTLASLPGIDGFTSLREAICASNNNPGADTINFNIPGNGVHTITLLTQPLTIQDTVTINGYSQTGATCNTDPDATNAVLKIVVDGNYAFDASIYINGDNSTIKGLIFQHLDFAIFTQSAGNTISGNFIGTDAAGVSSKGNGHGIQIAGPDNTVGGSGLCDRNLISGNGVGVKLYSAANNSTVINNLIGTDAAGTGRIQNVHGGVILSSAANITVRGNVISGNGTGISIENSTGPNFVKGNWIGVGVTHSDPMGNGIGIKMSGSSNTLIGGTGALDRNVIAYSLNKNVIVEGTGSSGNSIIANSIYRSAVLGIDLNNDGVTINDANDPDGGPNLLQNYPVLTNVTGDTIGGTLNSTSDTTFAIDFFASPTCSQSSYGEGRTYLGSTTVTTVNNDATFSFLSPTPLGGLFITAVATNLTTNSTSEFSRCFPESTGAISGTAYIQVQGGQVASNATIYACTTDRSYCTAPISTNSLGEYTVTGLPPGTYDILANPPSGSTPLGPTTHIDIVVLDNQTVTGKDVVFLKPVGLPPGVTIQPLTVYGGFAWAYWSKDFTIWADGCPGATVPAEFEIRQGGQQGPVLLSGQMSEDPAGSGSYRADIPAYSLQMGLILINIVIHCPDGTDTTFTFNMYIDPSGVVQSFLPNGTPAALPMATVTLYRSDDPNGPFAVVPNESALMSPGNRTNSDITRLGGQFGWDVVPGYYKVRANKEGCVKPGLPGQSYVDTYIMEIPPPVTDLVLQLDCGSPSFTDVHTEDYFYNAVTYLAAIGVLGGYDTAEQCPTGAPCFLPYNNVTRGQAAKIIANAVGLNDAIPVTQQTFQDVEGNPFWLYIERLYAHGYINGYLCGTECIPGDDRPLFRPGNNVTRYQIAKILVRSNQYATITPATAHFEDVPTTDEFYAYVETAYQKGLINGYPCDTECMPGNRPYFRGWANTTRGQLSKMVIQTLIAPTP
jgi:parallel beta-helix repeat protein